MRLLVCKKHPEFYQHENLRHLEHGHSVTVLSRDWVYSFVAEYNQLQTEFTTFSFGPSLWIQAAILLPSNEFHKVCLTK